jgi:hypothetical protein
MLADKIRSATAGEKLFVDDVFSTFIYDGNGSTQTITNGIDLAGKGGMVWLKGRSLTSDHYLYDTVRGAEKDLGSNTTAAEFSSSVRLTSFGSSGFSLGNSVVVNGSGNIYASWTFRKAPSFFDVQTISHTNGTATNISLTDLATVGTVIAKITNTTGDWITWHRSLTAGNNLRLNTTAAQTTTNAWLSVSGTTATLASTAPTGTYVIYAFAHDTATDGMIQCGGVAAPDIESGSQYKITLGWEPQYILFRSYTGVSDWQVVDGTRGTVGTGTPSLSANRNLAETSNPGLIPRLESDGFTLLAGVNGTYIYLAIRRPNKPPTSGTQVFNPTVYTGTNVDNRLINTGILTDMVWLRQRNGSGTGYEGFVVGDRLRGQPWLKTGATQAEQTVADGLDQQLVSSTEYGTAFSAMNGVWVGNNSGAAITATNVNANTTSNNHVALAFKRAPGFFDMVAYTGTGANRTVEHNLGVVPELIFVKSRSVGFNWGVYSAPTGAGNAMLLNTSDASFSGSTFWNSTAPASSVFSLGTQATVNEATQTYIAYLFASLPGISKVGTYTGNGTSQTINCGFTTGARFVLIKRTDVPGSWYVFDSARGIVAAEDPYIRTDGTAAEVAGNDSLDPNSTGFAVNQIGGVDINVTSATYIYLAIA